MEPVTEYRHFFFLLYASNPTRNVVQMYIDGSGSMLVMRHTAFINLIIETIGYNIEAAVRETLNTYGTYWLLDREKSQVTRVAVSGEADIRNIREMMNRDSQYHTPQKQREREGDTINPAEHLAYASLDLPFFNDPKEDQDTARLRRRGVSIITGNKPKLR
jgi:hypothetical protein